MPTTNKVQVDKSTTTAGTSTSTNYSYTYPKPKAEQGWECPRCGRINAPWVRQCDCSRSNWTITSDDWTYKPDWWKDVICNSDTFYRPYNGYETSSIWYVKHIDTDYFKITFTGRPLNIYKVTDSKQINEEYIWESREDAVKAWIIANYDSLGIPTSYDEYINFVWKENDILCKVYFKRSQIDDDFADFVNGLKVYSTSTKSLKRWLKDEYVYLCGINSFAIGSYIKVGDTVDFGEERRHVKRETEICLQGALSVLAGSRGIFYGGKQLMEKNKYTPLEMEIIEFDTEDVIVTSCTIVDYTEDDETPEILK